jgi:histone-lysine N-methyltransferase SETD8
MPKEARYPIRRKHSETDMVRDLLTAKNDFQLGLEIKFCPVKGRCIFATKGFKKGEYVVEYAGELITKQEANKRDNAYANSGRGCFLLQFEHQGKVLFLDATYESGRLGRLVNHSSRKPNCYIKKVVASGQPHIFLVAKQDICAGTELLWNYGERRKNILKYNTWLSNS